MMTVRLLLDTSGVARIALARETIEHGDHCAYYVATAPARAVLILRSGLKLEGMAGDVVEAELTFAQAPAGIARPGNERHAHACISVLRTSNDQADYILSLVIQNSPQDAGP